MAMILIYADTRGRGRCRSCDAEIEWAENTVTHKRMPFDAPIVAVKTASEQGSGRAIETVDTTVTKSHFATCPQAKQWRR